MKSVLISIQPKWCELIASGKKTVEVRKTRPKLETPFKVYIYCTHNGTTLKERFKNIYTDFSGKVIGEFVCDNIDNHTLSNLIVKEDAERTLLDTCLTKDEVLNYLGYKRGTNIFACKNYDFYGWHISDLVIYDKPKELSELKKINRECWYADLGLAKRDCPECQNKGCFVQRPPQSWCYVEGGGSDA